MIFFIRQVSKQNRAETAPQPSAPDGSPGPCPLQGGKIHYTGSVIKKIRHLTEYEVRGSFFILHRARLADES